jgi:hypothetical protein
MRNVETINTRFVPMYGLALLNLYPEDGGNRDASDHLGGKRDWTFEYDDETRIVKYERGTVGKLPKDVEACLVNTGEPINIFEYFVGKPKDVAELAKATTAFRSARDRLMRLLGRE